MIIPTHWAEAEITYRSKHRKNVRIKRMGWSMVSYEDAFAMAQQRCEEALREKKKNPNVPWRDLKVAYNGADGMPIREEVLEQTPAYTITRNGYGAACLNTPNVLFVDVDFMPEYLAKETIFSFLYPFLYGVFGWVVGKLVGYQLYLLSDKAVSQVTYSTAGAFVGILIACLAAVFTHKVKAKSKEKREAETLQNMHDDCLNLVKAHAVQNPKWNWRVYRTPHGMRLLATHNTFDPRSDDVQACFDFFKADYLYASMCKLQNCFRARVSPKPWRIDMYALEPRTVWPLGEKAKEKRDAWVTTYDALARNYASCRYLCDVGSGTVCAEAKQVVLAHDEKARALVNLSLA